MGKATRYDKYDRSVKQGRKVVKGYGEQRQSHSVNSTFRAQPLPPPSAAVLPANVNNPAGFSLVTNGTYDDSVTNQEAYFDIDKVFWGSYFDNAINVDVTQTANPKTTTAYDHIDATGTALTQMYSGGDERSGVEIISAGTSAIQFIKVSLKRTNPGTTLSGNVTVRLTDNSGTTIGSASDTLAASSVATSFTDYTFDMGSPTQAPNGTRVSVEYSAAGDASNYIEVEAITETSETGFGTFTWTPSTYTDSTTENASMTFDSAPANNANWTHTITEADFPQGTIEGFIYDKFMSHTVMNFFNADTVSRSINISFYINGDLHFNQTRTVTTLNYYTFWSSETFNVFITADNSNRDIQVGDVISVNVWADAKTTNELVLQKGAVFIAPSKWTLTSPSLSAYYEIELDRILASVPFTNSLAPYLGTNLTPTTLNQLTNESTMVTDEFRNTNILFYGTGRTSNLLKGTYLTSAEREGGFSGSNSNNVISLPSYEGMAQYLLATG